MMKNLINLHSDHINMDFLTLNDYLKFFKFIFMIKEKRKKYF